MARARISPWRRMRRSRAPSNGLGGFFAAQFSAGCTTNMSGFDCRQAQARRMVVVFHSPELPDDTPIERVLFSTRIQNALRAADLKTVGEMREVSDETLISLPDFGKGSLSDLREKLGLSSTDGVRPLGKKSDDHHAPTGGSRRSKAGR